MRFIASLCDTHRDISITLCWGIYRRHPSFLLDWFTCSWIISGGYWPATWCWFWNSTIKMVAGMFIVVFRGKKFIFFEKWKSPFLRSVHRVAAPEAIRTRATTESFFFSFAKTIKTVVAGSFVPQEKESLRYFLRLKNLYLFFLQTLFPSSTVFFFSERTTPFFTCTSHTHTTCGNLTRGIVASGHPPYVRMNCPSVIIEKTNNIWRGEKTHENRHFEF